MDVFQEHVEEDVTGIRIPDATFMVYEGWKTEAQISGATLATIYGVCAHNSTRTQTDTTIAPSTTSRSMWIDYYGFKVDFTTERA
jgi:hypothetical protein